MKIITRKSHKWNPNGHQKPIKWHQNSMLQTKKNESITLRYIFNQLERIGITPSIIDGYTNATIRNPHLLSDPIFLYIHPNILCRLMQGHEDVKHTVSEGAHTYSQQPTIVVSINKFLVS